MFIFTCLLLFCFKFLQVWIKIEYLKTVVDSIPKHLLIVCCQ